MSIIRGMRLLNSAIIGTTDGAEMESLLADSGRLAEFNQILDRRGQTRRMLANANAMTAVAASATAMVAINANSAALSDFNLSSVAIGKYVAYLAGLNPASYADMTAVAASATAMNAIIASLPALSAIFASSVAKSIFKASSAITAKSVPTMTSNSTPSGVAAASSVYDANYAAWKAFDKGGFSGWMTPLSTVTGWVSYAFTVPVYIHTAELTSLIAAEVNSFQIQCSSNNSTWTTVLSGTQPNSYNVLYSYDIQLAEKYRYWRLNCLSSYGSYAGIKEFELKGFA